MISVLRRSSAAPPPLCFLKCLKHPDGDLESHRRLFVCLSGKMRAKWRRRGEGTAGGTWGRSFISSWRIRGNLCISSGALQACKSNEGYGFLRSRTTARSGGCFGGNHKLLGWLTLRLALGEEKGKKTRIIMYVSDYDSSSCDLHLHLWQESWSSCTARSRGITESGRVSRHFVASLGSFVWRCCCFPRACWPEILIFKSHLRISCSHQTHKPPNSCGRSSKEP